MLSGPDKPPVPANPAPSGTHGKRRLVEEILRTFKKNKSDKDGRTWEWADRDLHASCGLKEGDKIFVKYEYEDILVFDADAASISGAVKKEQSSRSETPLAAAAEGNEAVATGSCAEDEGNILKVSERCGDDKGERGETVEDSGLGEIRSEEGGEAEEADQPGEYVCGCKIVWWPAIIERFEKENERGRCLSVREVVDSMGSELQGATRDRINEHLQDKGDLPVWQLRYEARDSMESETVPVFFMNNETLMHLHNQWGQGTYKTATTITDQSELDDEPLFDGLSALDFAMSALQNSFQEKDAEDEDDDSAAETVDDVRETSPAVSKTPLTAIESLVMHHFSGVLQRLTRTLSSREENSCVSAGEVWDFFSSLSDFDSSEQKTLKAFLRNPSAQPPVVGALGDSTDSTAVEKTAQDDCEASPVVRSLESDPFPRSCNSSSSASSSSNARGKNSPPSSRRDRA